MSPTRSKTGKLRLRRVALLIETSRTYGRGILRGIARYAHLHGQWSFFTVERELHSGIPDWLRRWKGDGIIARVESAAMARQLSKCGCPVVDVLGQAGLPRQRICAGFFNDITGRRPRATGWRGKIDNRIGKRQIAVQGRSAAQSCL